MSVRRPWRPGMAVVLLLACQPAKAFPGAEGPTASVAAPGGGAARGVPAAEEAGQAWEQVVAAARREGRVTAQMNPDERALFESAAAAVKREYGIEAEPV